MRERDGWDIERRLDIEFEQEPLRRTPRRTNRRWQPTRLMARAALMSRLEEVRVSTADEGEPSGIDPELAAANSITFDGDES